MKHYEVREGKKVWPTCTECGCRLNVEESGKVYHYGEGPKDAKGHTCSLVSTAWIMYSPLRLTLTNYWRG